MSPHDERPAHVPRPRTPGLRERRHEQCQRVAPGPGPAATNGRPGVEVTQHRRPIPVRPHFKGGRIERRQWHDEVAVAFIDMTAFARPVRPDDVAREIRDEPSISGSDVAVAIGPEGEHAARPQHAHGFANESAASRTSALPGPQPGGPRCRPRRKSIRRLRGGTRRVGARAPARAARRKARWR